MNLETAEIKDFISERYNIWYTYYVYQITPYEL